MNRKKELRKTILQIRDSLTAEQRHQKSKEITKSVIAHQAFCTADKILLFASYKSEVDTTELIRYALNSGKQVYLPKIEYNESEGRDEMEFYQIFPETELQEGYKGIREPKANPSAQFRTKQIPSKESVSKESSSKESSSKESPSKGLPSKELSSKEPPSKQEAHILMILPGAVFDRKGNRIGYGGGFYDRFLARIEQTVYKLAIAFECQVIESDSIPLEPHDVQVDTIITEKAVHVEKYIDLYGKT